MKDTLTPLEIEPGEWFICWANGAERYGYEPFSNRTYPCREACQKAIDRLYNALPDLLDAAGDVIDSWQGGDLARAVRKLDQVITKAWRGS